MTAEAGVLELADRMRRVGGCQPHRLYHECVEAFRSGGLEFGRVTVLYKHAMIHAGMIVPRDRERFFRCPECDAQLDIPRVDN